MKPPFRGKPGKKFGGKPFVKREGFGKPAGRPVSFKATCADCGEQCSVPFKPDGRRPIYCGNCLKRHDAGGFPGKKPWEKAARTSSEERQMHQAVCDRCGEPCEVPFKPLPGRPVFCPSCLGHGDKRPSKEIEQMKEEFRVINEKLDAILKALKSDES